MRIVTLGITAGVILLALLSSHTAWSAKLYKWVDKDGNISYQGSPPPAGSTLIKEEEITSTSNPNTPAPQVGLPVIVYTVDNCESCDALLLLFQNWGIEVQEQSLQSREVQARILELSDSLSAPTLFIGDKLISDMTTSNISSELQQAGYQIDESEDNETISPNTTN